MRPEVLCLPHPSSRICMVQGDHLAGCSLAACAGCVACGRHNHPRPVQVPASTSDARKRLTDAARVLLTPAECRELAGWLLAAAVHIDTPEETR